MASDPNQYYQDRQRQNREQFEKGLQQKGTLEAYQLEKQEARLPRWQQMVVNALALVGLFSIFYVLLDLLF